jgi:competence protein ComEA
MLFIGFMILVGVGILVTLTSEHTAKNEVSNNASTNFTPTSKTAISGPGFSVPATPTADPEIKVYVTGEIKNPGIYTMQKEDRLNDVLEAAGGLTELADISQLDLAQRVRDEMHINIPKLSQTTPVTPTLAPTATLAALSNSSNANITLPGGGTSAHSTTPSGANSGKINSDSGVKINLNTADINELTRLPGVGATLAQRLVDYRSQHGTFKSIEDLRHIQGFTRTVLDKIKDLIVF